MCVRTAYCPEKGITMTEKADSKKNHFGSREHRIEQLGLLAERVKTALTVFAGTPVADALSDADSAVVDAIAEAKGLSADWKPAGRVVSRKAKFVPEVGASVQIKAKKREKFAVIMSDADMGDLVVTAISGKKAAVKAPSGAVALVPMSQLSVKK